MNADELAAMEKLDTATLLTISAERDGSHRKQAALHILELRRAAELRQSSPPLQKSNDDKWYKKPMGIVTLSVIAGVFLLFIKFYFGL